MAEKEGKGRLPRESNNPMFEEYQEELLREPITTALDEERLVRVERLADDLLNRVESLERRIQALENKVSEMER